MLGKLDNPIVIFMSLVKILIFTYFKSQLMCNFLSGLLKVYHLFQVQRTYVLLLNISLALEKKYKKKSLKLRTSSYHVNLKFRLTFMFSNYSGLASIH